MSEDIFNDNNLVANNWWKAGKVGDAIHGTLISVREMTNSMPNARQAKVKVYEILAEGGSFFNSKNRVLDTTATVIKAGEIWNVGGGFGLDAQMRNITLGQKIGIKFTDEKPSKTAGFNPTKIKKVYVRKNQDGSPMMNDEWLAEKERQDAVDNFDK